MGVVPVDVCLSMASVACAVVSTEPTAETWKASEYYTSLQEDS